MKVLDHKSVIYEFSKWSLDFVRCCSGSFDRWRPSIGFFGLRSISVPIFLALLSTYLLNVICLPCTNSSQSVFIRDPIGGHGWCGRTRWGSASLHHVERGQTSLHSTRLRDRRLPNLGKLRSGIGSLFFAYGSLEKLMTRLMNSLQSSELFGKLSCFTQAILKRKLAINPLIQHHSHVSMFALYQISNLVGT